MAPRTAQQDPEQLVEVVWADTGDRVSIPRRLLNTGNKAAQMRYLISTNQLVDTEAPPLPPMQEPEQIIQATVDAAALQQVEARLSRLERQPAPILPSEQALASWSQQAARVGLVHSEMAALADQTVAAVEATAQAADERLSSLDAKQAALASTISDALSQAQEATAQAVLSMEQQAAGALSSIEEEAVVVAKKAAIPVAREVAALEAAKHWGSSVTIVTEDPREVDWGSFAKRWYGRDFLISGDGALLLLPTGCIPLRFTGRGWVAAAELETKVEVRDVRVQALSTGDTVYGGGGGSGSGSGSSTGQDPLTTRTVAGAATSSTQIADSLRWSIPLKLKGLPTPSSCKVAVQLTAADGTQAGKNLFVLAGLLYEPSGGGLVSTRFTEYSSLGDLQANVDVGFTMQIGTAGSAPGGVSASVPAGTNSTTIFLTIDKNTTGATQFFVAGTVEWLLPQAAVPDVSHGSIEPAWKV
jgi:hypothetical protein